MLALLVPGSSAKAGPDPALEAWRTNSLAGEQLLAVVIQPIETSGFVGPSSTVEHYSRILWLRIEAVITRPKWERCFSLPSHGNTRF